MSDVETCRNCDGAVEMMSQKGTGICGRRCEQADRQYQVDEVERARGSADLANAEEHHPT